MLLPNCKSPCAKCPFRKDSLKGWLGRETMRDILASSSFVCHKKQHLQCAGFMLLQGDSNQYTQLAKRLEMPLELSGRELIFDTEEQCIEHHEFDHKRA